MIGRTISHYKITEKLGEGGMGVVYKAEDLKLERTVALKFLAAHLLNDEEAKARFLREARAAAGLHHPNICPVYEISEAEGRTFLSMAFIKGEPLEARIEQGPLPLKEALDIGRQIAEGLEAAHEEGVVHRDIKPANVMVDAKGRATIMDFGLAHLTEASRLTKTDQTMGTVAYMSPEQAQGMEVDNRSDVWALGVVLYEMVCGQRPFQGQYDQALLYEIVHQEPEPLTAVRAGVPMELDFIVGKCLAKDRNDRPSSAEEIARDLRTLGEKLKSGRSTVLHTGIVTGPPAGSTQSPAQAESPSLPGPLAKYRVIEDVEETGDSIKYLAEDTELHRSVAIRVLPQSSEQQIERAQRLKQTVLLGTTALGVLLALVFAFFPLFSPAPVTEAPLRRFTLPTEGTPTRPSISPDGRHVAYLTGPQTNRVLWVQDLDQNRPRAIFGPDNLLPFQPAWSPDSQFIAFRLANELKKISIAGGSAATVCEVSGRSYGIAAWTPDGESIVFSMKGQLYRAPSRGGRPELWLEAQGEGREAAHPAFLSFEGGVEKLLYVEARTYLEAQIIALDRSSGRRNILAAGFSPSYAPSGHVFYDSIDPPGVWAVPFAIETMKASGDPFPVSQNGHLPSVALDGTLAYFESPASSGLVQLVWRDRGGNKVGTIGQPQGRMSYPALSPDGKRVAVGGREGDSLDIWIHEVERPIKTLFTTNEALDMAPTWSPTGEEIAFSSERTGKRDLYLKPAGGGEAKLLLSTPDSAQYMNGWSQDGKILLCWRRPEPQGQAPGDIFYLKQEEGGSGYEELPFLQTSSDERTPQLSPDGRFLAYVSNESGRLEVYIQSFPQGGGKEGVSVDGGVAPRWRADGKELFYVEGSTLMAVAVSTSPSLTVGPPESLFSSPILRGFLQYDVTPDGKKFVLPEALEAESETPPVIRIVQNWAAAFRDREQD